MQLPADRVTTVVARGFGCGEPAGSRLLEIGRIPTLNEYDLMLLEQQTNKNVARCSGTWPMCKPSRRHPPWNRTWTLKRLVDSLESEVPP